MSEDTTIEKGLIRGPRTVQEILDLLGGNKPVIAAAAFYDASGSRKGALIQGNTMIRESMLLALERVEPCAKYFVEETDEAYKMHRGEEKSATSFMPSRAPVRVLTPEQKKIEISRIVSTFQDFASENSRKILDFFEEPDALSALCAGTKEELDKLSIPGYLKSSEILKASNDWDESIEISLLAQGLWKAYGGCQEKYRNQMILGTLFHRMGKYMNDVETTEEYTQAKLASRKSKPLPGDLVHAVFSGMKLYTAGVTAKLITNHIDPDEWRSKDSVAKIAAVASETYNWLTTQRQKGDVNFKLSNPEAIAKMLVREANPERGKDSPGGVPSRTSQWLNLLSDSPNYIKSE